MANARTESRNSKWLAAGITLTPGGVVRAARVYITAWPAAATYVAGTKTFTEDSNGALGTCDGATMVVGDRVLYVAGGSSDGIYEITSLGGASSKFTAVRVGDLTSTNDFVNANGSTIAVYAGSTNIGKVITMSIASTFVMDTDTPTFTASSSSVSYANVMTALNAASGATNLDMSSSTGTVKPPTGVWTWQGKQAATATANSITDPGNAGAIVVTASGVCAITTAGAETRTVAIPAFIGQRLDLCMTVDGGDAVVTFASAINQTGNNTATFNDAGDCLSLIGVIKAGTRCWRVLANDGVSLSTV